MAWPEYTFHVPMSFVFIAFLIATIYSIMYAHEKMGVDFRARAASAGGFLFTLLATITGSIWARFSWGTFSELGSAPESSILILLLIYIAYFLLRSLLEEMKMRKHVRCSQYSCICHSAIPDVRSATHHAKPAFRLE